MRLGHIVDGDGFAHYRAEQRRPRHEADSAAERHRHQFGSLECLSASGTWGPARW
ncbi:MAG: hypothetical protein R2710_18905 [Acidimicrobiales bacterium]